MKIALAFSIMPDSPLSSIVEWTKQAEDAGFDGKRPGAGVEVGGRGEVPGHIDVAIGIGGDAGA